MNKSERCVFRKPWTCVPKLIPCFSHKTFLLMRHNRWFKQSSAKDGSAKTLALSKPLHQCLANLFSSSVKIMSEGADKHIMSGNKKSFRIHSFSFWQLLYYPDKYFANGCFYRLSTVMAAASFIISFISFQGLTQQPQTKWASRRIIGFCSLQCSVESIRILQNCNYWQTF